MQKVLYQLFMQSRKLCILLQMCKWILRRAHMATFFLPKYSMSAALIGCNTVISSMHAFSGHDEVQHITKKHELILNISIKHF